MKKFRTESVSRESWYFSYYETDYKQISIFDCLAWALITALGWFCMFISSRARPRA